jgi:hypothetical protein
LNSFSGLFFPLYLTLSSNVGFLSSEFNVEWIVLVTFGTDKNQKSCWFNILSPELYASYHKLLICIELRNKQNHPQHFVRGSQRAACEPHKARKYILCDPPTVFITFCHPVWLKIVALACARKYVLLVELVQNIAVSNCWANWRTLSQEPGRVLLMNTWRDAWESKQQKLNLTLKDYSSKRSIKWHTA